MNQCVLLGIDPKEPEVSSLLTKLTTLAVIQEVDVERRYSRIVRQLEPASARRCTSLLDTVNESWIERTEQWNCFDDIAALHDSQRATLNIMLKKIRRESTAWEYLSKTLK